MYVTHVPLYDQRNVAIKSDHSLYVTAIYELTLRLRFNNLKVDWEKLKRNVIRREFTFLRIHNATSAGAAFEYSLTNNSSAKLKVTTVRVFWLGCKFRARNFTQRAPFLA